MPVKVYGCPTEVPPPKIDYANYDHAKAVNAEQKHKENLKAFLIDRLNFTGKNTGRIYQEQVADGYALYMVAEAPKVFALIHLPYGDGYQSRNVAHLPKRVILDRIEEREARFATFNRIPPKAKRKAK